MHWPLKYGEIIGLKANIQHLCISVQRMQCMSKDAFSQNKIQAVFQLFPCLSEVFACSSASEGVIPRCSWFESYVRAFSIVIPSMYAPYSMRPLSKQVRDKRQWQPPLHLAWVSTSRMYAQALDRDNTKSKMVSAHDSVLLLCLNSSWLWLGDLWVGVFVSREGQLLSCDVIPEDQGH